MGWRRAAIALVLLTAGTAGAAPEEAPLPPLLEGLLALAAPARDWEPISEATQQPVPKVDPIARLRRWMEKDPSVLARQVGYVEPDAALVRDVARLAESDADRTRFDAAWHEEVDAWVAQWRRRLLPEYRAELVQAALALRRGDYGLEGEEEVDALAAADWAAARAVLDELRRNPDARVRAYATCYLYGRAAPDEAAALRAELRRMAEDRRAPGYARDAALDALRASEWPGRDAWLLSLFEDPTLLRLVDGNMGYGPLNQLVASDPDRWIPEVASMVGGSSRAAHDNAVAALVQFHLEEARADALAPLLPWIADPTWSSAPDRLRLLQSLKDLPLPGSLPGLIAVIEREDGWPLRAAAEAVAELEAPDAVPALRQALLRCEPDVQLHVWRALQACGGAGLEARVAARVAHALRLEAEAAGTTTPDTPASDTAGLGAYLIRLGPPHRAVAEVLLREAAALEAEHPAAAAHLRTWVGPWPRPDPHAQLLDALAAGRAEPEAVAEALGGWRRAVIAERQPERLAALVAGGGIPAGCAALILGDPRVLETVLSGRDRDAQMGLLACARLARHALEIPKVVTLAGAGHAGLARVADAYLLALDTPEARKAVLARHPGEAWIAGVAGYHTEDWEERLREEVLAADGPREVIALLSSGAWGPVGQVVIRVGREAATLTFHYRGEEDRVRTLPADRLDEVRDYLEKIEAHTLPAYRPSIHDGVHYTFLRLTRDGGYRIYMNNPGSQFTRKSTEDVYARLTRLFRSRVWRED